MMFLSILVCLWALVSLAAILRVSRVSLGLPVAYLAMLLLIHVPGAYAHVVSKDFVADSEYTLIGIRMTAVGAVCFVLGVWAIRQNTSLPLVVRSSQRRSFQIYCLVWGWFITYGLSFLTRIPSLGAAIDKAGAVWMLGTMLALRAAVARRDLRRIAIWSFAVAVYPALMLLLGGFLSYGSAAIIIVFSILIVSGRSRAKVAVGACGAAIIGLNMFLSYFGNRNDIRDAVWGGAGLQERVAVSLQIVRDFEVFNPLNEAHIRALDQRLNQNYYVGLAATRLEYKAVTYLYGRSLWEGVLALVPRAVWPDKPVFAGSPRIVSEMTGLHMSEGTSFGVGNVMELYINFGWTAVIVGFFAFGCLLGKLDLEAARAEFAGDLSRVFVYFLPAVALIQPNGSFVEMASGSSAALLAAVVWRSAWRSRSRRQEVARSRVGVVGG